MRINFNEKVNRPKLEFGKSYSITLFACSFWWEFTFTRKNRLLIREVTVKEIINGFPQQKTIRMFKMSKRELKRLLKDEDFFQWVCEV